VTSDDALGPKVDRSVPQSARVWNYWLGGTDNYEVDRRAGDAYAEVYPQIVELARTSRLFLARAVGRLAGEAGVRQFLDIGAGLPTVDNTHEVAQRIAPDAHVVYVDNDPLVLAHARALLTSTPEGATAYIEADLHEPADILEKASRTLDLSRPVALMLMGIMGHVADEAEIKRIIGELLEPLPSGSFLTLYDGTATDEAFTEAQEGYDETGAVPYRLRRPEQIAGFFEGLDLVEPGVVPVNLWRPEPSPFPPAEVHAYGGIGRKR